MVYYDNIHGPFTRDISSWHKKDITDQTWKYFKIFFDEAATDFVTNISTTDIKYSAS